MKLATTCDAARQRLDTCRNSRRDSRRRNTPVLRATNFRRRNGRSDPHAHACGIPASTMMYGHRKLPTTGRQLICSADSVRDGGFTEFVPLGSSSETLLFQQDCAHRATLAEHLKYASPESARGSIITFKSRGEAERSFAACLHAGANDYGGTLMRKYSREAGASAASTQSEISSIVLRLAHSGGAQHEVSRMKIKCRESVLPTFLRKHWQRSSHERPRDRAIAVIGAQPAGTAGAALARRRTSSSASPYRAAEELRCNP